MVNVDDPAEATAELRRCHALGLAGALITVAPPAWLPYRSRDFDGFWATAGRAAHAAQPARRHRPRRPARRRIRAEREERAAVDLREQGLSGAAHAGRLHVLRGLRASPGAADGHGRARARLDPVLPAAAGLHLHRQAAARPGMAPLHGPRHPAVAVLSHQLLRQLPGGLARAAAARHDRRRDPDVGERLSRIPNRRFRARARCWPRCSTGCRTTRSQRIVAGNAAELYSFTLPDGHAAS